MHPVAAATQADAAFRTPRRLELPTPLLAMRFRCASLAPRSLEISLPKIVLWFWVLWFAHNLDADARNTHARIKPVADQGTPNPGIPVAFGGATETCSPRSALGAV